VSMQALLLSLVLLIVSVSTNASPTPVCSVTMGIPSPQILLSTGTIVPGQPSPSNFYPVYFVSINAKKGDKLFVESSFEVTTNLPYAAALYRYLAVSDSPPAPTIQTTVYPTSITVSGLVMGRPSGDNIDRKYSWTKRDTIVGWHETKLDATTDPIYISLILYTTSSSAKFGDYLTVQPEYGHICVTNFGQ
jgi:hypothetical protein